MTDLSALRYSQLPPDNRSCGLRAALDIVAGKWKPLILWHLLPGPVRFGALRREVGGISEKVLAEQLVQLERDDIVIRTQISDQPLAVDYALTARGRTLVPVLAAMSAWGFEHVVEMPTGAGPGDVAVAPAPPNPAPTTPHPRTPRHGA